MLAAHRESKLLFAYLFSFYHKLAEYVLTQRKTFCELNNLLNHRLQDDSVSVKMQCSKRLLYFSLTKPSVFPLKNALKIIHTTNMCEAKSPNSSSCTAEL